MFYILFLKLYQIYLIISSANHYLAKKVKEIKKVTFFMVTLDNFLGFINSPGGRALNKICLDMTRYVMTYM